MKHLIALLFAAIILSACLTTSQEVVNEKGNKIFVSSIDSAHLVDCHDLGLIVEDFDLTTILSVQKKIDFVEARLKNKVADDFPLADTIAYDKEEIGLLTLHTTIKATAYSCFV